MKAMTFRSSKSMSNCEATQLPRSFAELTRTYSETRTTWLKFNALVTYPVHVLWLNSTGRRKKYLLTHGHALLRFFSAETAEMGVDDEVLEVRESTSLYELNPLDVVFLLDLVMQTP